MSSVVRGEDGALRCTLHPASVVWEDGRCVACVKQQIADARACAVAAAFCRVRPDPTDDTDSEETK